ncbi:unnamed protein product, partial [Iphiclides podalirius]
MNWIIDVHTSCLCPSSPLLGTVDKEGGPARRRVRARSAATAGGGGVAGTNACPLAALAARLPRLKSPL